MASKNTEIKQEKEIKAREAFQADLLAVEKKHGLKLIPMINYSNQGLYPSLGVQEIKPEEEVK